MGWEPRGSAASPGIHQFCQVWPSPRPEHTTSMAQDVGGKEMNKTELKEEERRETKGKQKRNGERQARDKREMEGQRGSKAAGTDLKAEAFRKEWQKERPPDTALSFGCPFPVLPR